MSTYQKEYSIKWLNINPNTSTIEVLYSVNAILDTKEIAPLPDFKIIIKDDKYNQLFSLPINALGKDTVFGQLLSYFAACGGRVINPDFPINQDELDLFGTLGIGMLNENTNGVVNDNT